MHIWPFQAEEITLTIGQAFDLAYRRFVETSGREVEMRRQLLILQKRVQGLEDENQTLKLRITQLATLKNRPDVDEYMRENNVSLILLCFQCLQFLVSLCTVFHTVS